MRVPGRDEQARGPGAPRPVAAALDRDVQTALQLPGECRPVRGQLGRGGAAQDGGDRVRPGGGERLGVRAGPGDHEAGPEAPRGRELVRPGPQPVGRNAGRGARHDADGAGAENAVVQTAEQVDGRVEQDDGLAGVRQLCRQQGGAQGRDGRHPVGRGVRSGRPAQPRSVDQLDRVGRVQPRGRAEQQQAQPRPRTVRGDRIGEHTRVRTGRGRGDRAVAHRRVDLTAAAAARRLP